MALLKEDGSLDIERINKLPLEEYWKEMGTLTQEQIEDYITKLPVNESNEPMQVISVDFPIEKYGVNADTVINNLRCKYGIKS